MSVQLPSTVDSDDDWDDGFKPETYIRAGEGATKTYARPKSMRLQGQNLSNLGESNGLQEDPFAGGNLAASDLYDLEDEAAIVAIEDEKSEEELKRQNQICHITSADAWKAAKKHGVYRHATLRKSGFIHCYTHRQLGAACNHFFNTKSKLTVLFIDKTKLTSEMKMDVVRPNLPPFPHIYGPINLDAVDEVKMVTRKYEKWHVHLCKTPCELPGQWLLSCICPPCRSFMQRKTLLEGRMHEQYLCCGGVCIDEQCCCVPLCRKCPNCCLCAEVIICCWCSIVGNRAIIQKRYGIKNSKCETCIFRICCVISVIRMLSPVDLGPICDAAFDIMYCALAACMITQQNHEIQMRKKIDAQKTPLTMKMTN
eukprot:TRINITY_DN2839_c0_g1_i1.p1 TRINITY_DN2839_c0_g1~~TRINITY_DN2839_c0_g1_i1.p1  ORF type:complete len:368 (+),score=72.91 TRINITY_DN2839_c0_g1_i1:226-1329(+)